MATAATGRGSAPAAAGRATGATIRRSAVGSGGRVCRRGGSAPQPAPPRPRAPLRPSSHPRPPAATPDTRHRTSTAAPSSTTHSFSHTVSSSRRSCDTTSSVAGESGHERLDRLAGRDVEVVRRLVEQQQVRRHDPEQRQLEPRPLAARQRPDLLERVVAAEQEAGEVAARLAGRDRDRLEERIEHGRPGDRRARAAGRGTRSGRRGRR